ncbi:MAG: GH1 family beta-glucosidase [Fibrobacterota bacterium]
MPAKIFPDSFAWGCATASYQVEGAANVDGRGPSIWDTYSHTPGRVDGDHTGDVSVDQYHRYPEDIKIMQGLGLKAYRLSISWSRVMPEGEGRVNEKGIQYYERLVDALLAAGILPYVTLFHWDLPQALQDKYGGWKSRETSKRFADYTAMMTKRLSDRVTNWFTFNEFSCFIDGAYGPTPWHPPAEILTRKGLNDARHNALMAHGLGALAIRANAKKTPRVGLAENALSCTPIIETPENIVASEKAMREVNAHFLTAIMEGAYTERYLRLQGAEAPTFTPEEMKTIGTPLDFVGLNCYTAHYIRAAQNPDGFEHVPVAAGHPKMDTAWLYVDPQCLYWGVRNIAKCWNPKEIYITENGCAAKDKYTVNKNEILDTDRIMYLRGHLKSAERAVQEGLPLKGYFLWSLLDNFEWARGYTQRFGIVYVNYETLARTPKLSAEFYREIIKQGRVA